MVSTTEHHTTAATGGLVSAAGPQPQQKEYDLNFQRTLLDLMEICQLLHNSKLEMVPVSRSREGPENIVGVQWGSTVAPLLSLCWVCGALDGTSVG